MCGIAGIWSARALATPLSEAAGKMLDVLAHRGPDGAGVWRDETRGVALAHRRLAILDLSPAGQQPMASVSGRFVLAFNGEIYNHLELRQSLDDRGLAPWRGHSDTETLLAAIEAWGLEETLRRSVGMFAIALWDREEGSLTLARDRLGEKPLYYGWSGDTLLFASELKALRAFPGFSNPLERRALALFMRHNYVPSPWSIYQGVWKLPPASFVRLTQPAPAEGGEGRGEVRAYWSALAAAGHGEREPFGGSEEEALDGLEQVILQSLSGQMMADVPLGAFLSGGIDSSTIVALMQSRSSSPVKTFTIGFHEGGYDEAQQAKAIAQHLGTEHTDLYVTPGDAREVIPQLPALYDEPFADSSQVPTHLVARLARQRVTVALSGDGGDELFGGYNRYFWATRLWRKFSRIPLPLRYAMMQIACAIPVPAWNRLFDALPLASSTRMTVSGDRVHKAAGLLASTGPEDIYRTLVSHWDDPSRVVLGVSEPGSILTDPSAWLATPDLEKRMMYLDTVTYLPDDILVKVDRAAMGVSLETRVPLLDHRVLEFAWRLPLAMKIRAGEGKYLLRQLLYRHVPKALMDRPKMGFGVPIDSWLRGPLRPWAEDLLAEDRLSREGYFQPQLIRTKWAEHLSGRRNWAYHLWDVLMFQSWQMQWK